MTFEEWCQHNSFRAGAYEYLLGFLPQSGING